jgi:Domain of unknown function DUF29
MTRDLINFKPEHCSKSWISTIIEHRIRINKELKASPSFKRYFEQVFDDIYQDYITLASGFFA